MSARTVSRVFNTLFDSIREYEYNFIFLGNNKCTTKSTRETYIMSTKKINDEGIRKIASGMKKATDKYGLPTKKKDSKKK